MANDLETMVRQQQQDSLSRMLDSAVQAGDINAARNATRQLAQLAISNSKSTTPAFTNEDIRAVLKTKAPWFGVDPRRSARAVEFGKNMEPASFVSAEAFANELIKSVAKEFEDENEDEPEEDEEEELEEELKKVVRKKTDAPSSTGARAVPRRSSGPWMKLSDAPKEVAQTIRNSADKFTRNASKEQRDRYIAVALGTAYAADQRTRGKK